MLKPEEKEELLIQFKIIRENKLLILAVLIGVIGSLIAGVINDIIRESSFYPWKYLLVLTIILLVLILYLLRKYLSWKIYLYQINKWMKNYKRVLKLGEEHYKKYPKT